MLTLHMAPYEQSLGTQKIVLVVVLDKGHPSSARLRSPSWISPVPLGYKDNSEASETAENVRRCALLHHYFNPGLIGRLLGCGGECRFRRLQSTHKFGVVVTDLIKG